MGYKPSGEDLLGHFINGRCGFCLPIGEGGEVLPFMCPQNRPTSANEAPKTIVLKGVAQPELIGL